MEYYLVTGPKKDGQDAEFRSHPSSGKIPGLLTTHLTHVSRQPCPQPVHWISKNAYRGVNCWTARLVLSGKIHISLSIIIAVTPKAPNIGLNGKNCWSTVEDKLITSLNSTIQQNKVFLALLSYIAVVCKP